MPKTRLEARSDRRFSNMKPWPLRATFGRFSSWRALSERDFICLLPQICGPVGTHTVDNGFISHLRHVGKRNVPRFRPGGVFGMEMDGWLWMGGGVMGHS